MMSLFPLDLAKTIRGGAATSVTAITRSPQEPPSLPPVAPTLRVGPRCREGDSSAVGRFVAIPAEVEMSA